MTIKSSKTLIDKALNQIKTLKAKKIRELFEKGKYNLMDIRDISEI